MVVSEIKDFFPQLGRFSCAVFPPHGDPLISHFLECEKLIPALLAQAVRNAIDFEVTVLLDLR